MLLTANICCMAKQARVTFRCVCDISVGISLVLSLVEDKTFEDLLFLYC